MSVIEFEAEKALFAREVLNIDDIEIFNNLKKACENFFVIVKKQEDLKPYTTEELHDRIHKAQKEIEEGKGIAGDEVMRRLSEKIANKINLR